MQSKFKTDDGANGQGDPSSDVSEMHGASALPTEVRDFVTDVGDLITATTSLTGADLARAKAQLVERATAAKAALLKMGAAIGDHARQGARATDTYVHQKPWQAIGVGALFGLAVGILLARRRG